MIRRIPFLTGCLALIIGSILFFYSGFAFAEGNLQAPNAPSLKEARENLEKQLLGSPGFAGITHSEKGEAEIIVFLENEHSGSRVPDSFGGFPVKKVVTGKFKAVGIQLLDAPTINLQQVSSVRTSNVRPLVGGTSLSANIDTYAGTLGMVTYNNKILSNAHVIALNPNTIGFLASGTPIIQPGSYDGGATLSNQVGVLQKYININFKSSKSPNYADAAIATPLSGVTSTYGIEYSETGNYQVSGTTTVGVGDTVRKSGRTSGVTTSTVSSTNASVIVYYNSSKWAYFKDQIIVNQPFIQAGDSGSCVDKGGSFAGLAFAASSTQAIVCKASYIINGLGISIQ